MKPQLDKIFQPKSIAVIGASNKEGSVGFALMKNLLKGGFKGEIFPVNLRHNQIQGIACYKSVLKIPEPVDMAIIATPANTVSKVLAECGKVKISGVVILSAGFKEAGEKGNELYQQILRTARKNRIRIIGPNCVGFINPSLGINASFLSRMALPGKIAFISQSGALNASILDWSVDQNVGFSHFVSVGSMIDVDFADLIDYFGTDNRTSCILIYMESLTNARKFMSAARAFSRYKPIIVLKAGKSGEGAKAALSHTGSLAGNDAVFDAAFRRAGIIRVERISQLFHCAQALSMQPRPEGNRLAIVTNAGGPGVLATDFLVNNGGEIASLSSETLLTLDKLLPAHWSHNNPVDVLGDANAETYKESVKACLLDENTDAVLAIFTTQGVTDPTEVAKALVNMVPPHSKTIFACWMGEQDVQAGRELLELAQIPHFRYPESAVDVFMKMYHYSHNLKLLQETPSAMPSYFQPDKTNASHLIHSILDEGRYQLMEFEAKQLLQIYNIPTAPYQVVHSPTAAARAAAEIGFPVVMKIVSPDIGHKTEAGGVRLNIKSSKNAAEVYSSLIQQVKEHQPSALVKGVLVEKMISKRYELLIGAKKDPIFGPVIVFGMGGVLVELLKDTNMGLPPLNMALAKRIMEKTKAFRLLEGYRGMPKVNMEVIQFLLVKFSYLLMDFPEIREIDINPFAVDEKGGFALDAHIVLEKDLPAVKGLPYQHLVISPYLGQYVKKVQLKNGKEVLLRPIRPEDEPMEAEMFKTLSKQSIYYRFFGYVPEVNHDFLIRFTQIDYDREMAIIAEIDTDEGKKMAGVVRIVCDAWKETAEFAIVVADPWQGNGLGQQMTDFIFEIAKDMDIGKIVAYVLQTNLVMLDMLQKRGFLTNEIKSGEYFLELDLTPKPVTSRKK